MAAPEPFGEQPLAGKRIALLENRELDRLGRMVEAQGASALRCPLVAIVDPPDPVPVVAWLRRFVEAPPDDLVLMTGEGLRRLCDLAARNGVGAAFRNALGRVRAVTRGPKPARALREIGLSPGLRPERATTDGIIATLAGEDLRGRRVGVQLYPEAPDTFLEFLREAGAQADAVTPYAYAAAVEKSEFVRLIDAMAKREVDAIAFTSASQVTELFSCASVAGVEAQLQAALHATPIAAVGPVVAAELERRGLAVAIMPRDSFFMKPLVSALVAALSAGGEPR